MNKIKIKESVGVWGGYDFSGSLPDIIAKLQKLITDNPTFFDFEIEVESEGGYYGDHSANVSVIAYRWETDEEMESRIATSKKKSEAAKLAAIKQAEANEKREKSLY
jgi:RNA binding exosome subunit